MKHYAFALLLPLFLSSCDLIKYHPYEMVNDCETNLIAKNKEELSRKCAGRDTLRFAFISDTQRNYDDTQDAVDYINQQGDIDFVLHGGDITDFGLADEYDWMISILTQFNMPWLTVIGNHDFYGTGEYNYAQIFGDYNWSVNAGHLHILGLNTNFDEAKDNVKIPDFDFIQNDLNEVKALNNSHQDSITHTLFIMHVRPDDEIFSEQTKSRLDDLMQEFPGYSNDKANINLFALNGHSHHLEQSYALGDNILFFCVPDIKNREMMIFNILPQGYTYETVEY